MSELEKKLLEATGQLPAASNNELKIDDNKSSNVTDNSSNIKEINGVKYNSETSEIIKDSLEAIVEGTYVLPKEEFIDNEFNNALREYKDRLNKEIKPNTDYLGTVKNVDCKFDTFTYNSIIIHFIVNGLEYEDAYPIQGGNYDKFYFKKLMEFLASGEINLDDLDFTNMLNLSRSLDELLSGAKILVTSYKTQSGYLKFNNTLISKYDQVSKKMID